jgi:predicted RNase H-like nuclease
VGPRRASVFMTPVRAALEAARYAAAVRANREQAGEGISAQAYGLRPKILEVNSGAR